MPLYKHSLTDQLEDMSEDVASIYEDGVFEMVAEDSNSEEAARIRRQALEDKVDIDLPLIATDDTAEGETN